MIYRITGILESLDEGVAVLDPGQGLAYEVMLPTFAAARLGAQIGSRVTLHTVHYLEGSSAGGNMTPRLAGFLSERDRDFFELFTTTRGIGPRKGLRAMALASGQIAAAIADRDLKLLQSLPEIGRRMAETVVATLHGKVDRFLDGSESAATGGGQASAAEVPTGPVRSIAREALEVLVQLGENRSQALLWIDQVMHKQPQIETSGDLVTAVLRLKTGA